MKSPIKLHLPQPCSWDKSGQSQNKFVGCLKFTVEIVERSGESSIPACTKHVWRQKINESH